jgi:isopenicillin N synthase-like dioxygenase|uniref:Fe2OG dioxygenase domain-containing protein n=1 Tax=Globisporangium ultimum (strain ATCC 200006 / CBS 805.95 / DAOM BR144) TaxID=431595 RepID=K3WAM5_GLOUD
MGINCHLQDNSDVLSVPIVDIGALMAAKTDADVDATLRDPTGPFQATVEALRSAAVDWGFFYITNHGISPQQMEEFQTAMRAFFALPQEIKNRIRRTPDNSRGYFDGELTKNKVDWKQVFDFAGPQEDGPPDETVYKRMSNDQNRWLDEDVVPGFRETMTKYANQMQHISRRILMLFAVTLGERFDFFDQFYRNPLKEYDPSKATKEEELQSSSLLRLNYYPVSSDPASTMGVYEHTDPGALTVLLQDDEVASLQVFHRGSQQWLMVPPIEDTFVINIGDMVQIWSNDKFIAPLHRVLASGDKERYSAPYFHHPSYEAAVKPVIVNESERPKYHAITWRQFMTERVAGNYADFGEEIQISRFQIHYDDEKEHSVDAVH